MKHLCGIAVAALASLLATVALANPIDPQIIVETPLPPPTIGTNIVGALTFSFTSAGSDCSNFNGTGSLNDCLFLNNTGQTWNDLTFTITPTGQFTNTTDTTSSFFLACSGGIFSTCTPAANGSSVHFTGGLIPSGSEFFLSLSGWSRSGFTSPTTFVATASVVPEPGTMALLLTGAGALLARYKRRRVRTP